MAAPPPPSSISPAELDEVVARANELSLGGQPERAALLYARCLAAQPRHFGALANLAIQEMELGRAGPALALYERALCENQDWFEGHYNAGNLYAEQGPEGEASAIAHYSRAVELEPADADAWNNLSICLNKAGRLRDALEAAKKAVRLDKDGAPLANLAALLYESGDSPKALFFAQKAQHKRPADSAVATLLATLHAQAGDRRAAIAALEAVVGQGGALELPTRLRLASLLTAEPEDRPRARLLLERTAELYAATTPHDRAGLRALRIVSGSAPAAAANAVSASAGGASPSTSPSATSYASEMLLLHLSLDGAEALSHKCRLADSLLAGGCQDVAPPTVTCADADAVWAAVQDPANAGTPLWYLKDPMLQRGQGVTVLTAPVARDAVDHAVPKGRRVALQRAVDPLLLEGRKFGVRMHALLVARPLDGKLSVLMCRDGILTKCWREYSARDASPLAQITCTSVQRGEEGFDRSKVKGAAAHMWPGFSAALPAIGEAVVRVVRAVRGELVKAAPRVGDPLRAQLFGLDFLFDLKGKPVFIEANVSPQFQHAKEMEGLRRDVAVPMLDGLADALAAVSAGDALPDTGASGRWSHLANL